MMTIISLLVLALVLIGAAEVCAAFIKPKRREFETERFRTNSLPSPSESLLELGVQGTKDEKISRGYARCICADRVCDGTCGCCAS